MSEKEKGYIHHYNTLKGFGFIRREKGKDVFFFFNDFITGNADIVIGDIVEFVVVKEAKGPRAYEITVT